MGKKTAKKKGVPKDPLPKQKKPDSSPNPQRSPRKQDYNSNRILAIVERLREQATRLNGLAKTMEESGVEQVVVDGHAMLLRGLNQIDNFADNAARAVREAKNELDGI